MDKPHSFSVEATIIRTGTPFPIKTQTDTIDATRYSQGFPGAFPEHSWLCAVKSAYVPRGKEVQLTVNTSLYLQHAKESQAAMGQARAAGSKPNLVVVLGQPSWYQP